MGSNLAQEVWTVLLTPLTVPSALVPTLHESLSIGTYGFALVGFWLFLTLAPERVDARRALCRAAVLGSVAAVIAADLASGPWPMASAAFAPPAELGRAAGTVAAAVALGRAVPGAALLRLAAALFAASEVLLGALPATVIGAGMFGAALGTLYPVLGRPWEALADAVSIALGVSWTVSAPSSD